MKIEPPPYELINRAKEAGVHRITLNFSGGSDEGYLNVTLNDGLENHELENAIEEWAWEVYDYNGAGDGSDYGDDIVYDLKTMKATITDWFMTRSEGGAYSEDLEIDHGCAKNVEYLNTDAGDCENHSKSEAQFKLLQCLVYWAAMNEDCVSEELGAIIERAKQLTQS